MPANKGYDHLAIAANVSKVELIDALGALGDAADDFIDTVVPNEPLYGEALTLYERWREALDASREMLGHAR